MFFNRQLLVDGSLKDAWRTAHRDTIVEDDVSIPDLCERLRSRIDANGRDRRGCWSLRSAAFFLSGVTRLYRQKVQKVYEDSRKLNSDILLALDESDYENDDDSSERETSLSSSRKRRLATSNENNSSHSSRKIRSKHSLPSDTEPHSQTNNDIIYDFSCSSDDDEEIDNSEAASSDSVVIDRTDSSQMIYTRSSSYNIPQGEISMESEGVDFHGDLPFVDEELKGPELTVEITMEEITM